MNAGRQRLVRKDGSGCVGWGAPSASVFRPSTCLGPPPPPQPLPLLGPLLLVPPPPFLPAHPHKLPAQPCQCKSNSSTPHSQPPFPRRRRAPLTAFLPRVPSSRLPQVAHIKDEGTPNEQRSEFVWGRNRLFDHHAAFVLYEMVMEDPTATVQEVRKREKRKWRPLPLSTVELQKLAARHLRMGSEQTMNLAEGLYNEGFLSYPRTETDRFSMTDGELGQLVQVLGLLVSGNSWAFQG